MSFDSTDIFVPAQPPIGGEFTLEDLQEHLQTAIVVEMSTIPLYLYAYFSIKEGDGDTARETIRGIFKEEMLHLALVSNTLYAIGKTPTLYDEKYIPTFPSNILYTSIKMNLRDGRRENIETFVDIEAPYLPKVQEISDGPDDILTGYRSIGEFYEAIEKNFDEIKPSISKEARNQIKVEDGIWHDNKLIVVTSLEQAKAALDTIIIQGEGSGKGEDCHYKKFKDLAEGTTEWKYHPVVKNPKTENYSKHIFYEVLRTFDAAYCYLLLNIERLYQVSKQPDREDCKTNIQAVMRKVIPSLTRFLRNEIADSKTGEVAGPCFNYYKLDPKDPLASLKNEIAASVVKYKDEPEKQKDLEGIKVYINTKMKQLPAAET